MRRSSPRLQPSLAQHQRQHHQVMDDGNSTTKLAEEPSAVEEEVVEITSADFPNEDTTTTTTTTSSYFFDGRSYPSYQAMVDAKRSRNQQMLIDSGLLDLAQEVASAAGSTVRRVSADGESVSKKKKRRSDNDDMSSTAVRRKSNRLAGIESDGVYVEEERAGRFVLATTTRVGATKVAAEDFSAASSGPRVAEKPEHYRGRINDGSPLTIVDAVQHLEAKWIGESTASDAERFVREELDPLRVDSVPKASLIKCSASTAAKTPPSHLQRQVDELRADDEALVAKVTPDRIYGIAVHPHPDSLLVAAGDKTGCVGIWKAPHGGDSGASVPIDGLATKHLFRIHSGAASCLQWTTSGSKLFSASYDGTIRCLDVTSERFEQVFATYDDSDAYKDRLGHRMDTGYNYWTQYACLDSRSGNGENGLFVSTSIGTAMHIDLRAANGSGRVTFHEELSEKKINTLSLHPNGHTLVSAGLDCTVKIWDLRKMRDSRSTSKYKAPEPLAFYHATKSVNSAFVSPSGQYVVCTTMANRLDLLQDVHLSPSSTSGKSPTIKPSKRIVHDNMTGRWLSTFMAQWHPSLDIFCVGSMSRPRCVQVFDAQGTCMSSIAGDALTAVASRCCFHPSEARLAIAGGNSSGRVTIIR